MFERHNALKGVVALRSMVNDIPMALFLGANGFLGHSFAAYLVEQAKQGIKFPFYLAGIDRKAPSSFLENLGVYDDWAIADMAKPNLAAQRLLGKAYRVYHFIMDSSGEDPIGVQSNTMLGMFKFAREDARFIIAGSNSALAQLGHTYVDIPNLGEKHRPRPMGESWDAYPWSKAFAEHMVEEVTRESDRSAVVFRITMPEMVSQESQDGWAIDHRDFGEYLWRAATVSDEQLFGCRKVKYRRLQLCHPEVLRNVNMEETEKALGYKCQYLPA